MQSQQSSVNYTGTADSRPTFLIAVISVAGLVGLAAVAAGWFMFTKLGEGPVNTDNSAPAPVGAVRHDSGIPPAPPNPGGSYSAAPAASPGAYASNSAPAGTYSPAAAAPPARVSASASAGVPTRKNAFDVNSELAKSVKAVPPPPGPVMAVDRTVPVTPALWQQLQSQRPPDPGPVTLGESQPGPPIPAMRVAAIQQGAQVSAVLQIGGEFMQVTPGKRIPEGQPVYWVERIEGDRVILVRRWEANGAHGTQRIEVTLQGATPQGGSPTPFNGPRPGAG